MKYVITGSLGNISQPITEELVKKGQTVTLISSKSASAAAIEKLGATPAIGSIEDVDFLTRTFTGADAVYLMIPPNFGAPDLPAYQKKAAEGYGKAIKDSGVKKIVLLSSIGAHMKKGAGPVDGLAYLEDVLHEIRGIDVLALRPSYFYTNLFAMVSMIKHAGIMGSAQPADYTMVLTHPRDIAAVAVEKLLALDFKGQTHQYIASDERTWKEITEVLTGSVQKEGINWVEFTDEQSLQGMLDAGLTATIAEGYVAMGQALRNGEMQADYQKDKPAVLGKTKLEDFAKEFAAAYQS